VEEACISVRIRRIGGNLDPGADAVDLKPT